MFRETFGDAFPHSHALSSLRVVALYDQGCPSFDQVFKPSHGKKGRQ